MGPFVGRRRIVLALLVVVAVLVGHDLLFGGPDRPDELTNATVEEYVAEHDRQRHGGLLFRKTDIGCDATVLTRDGDEFVVLSECSGGAYFWWGGHADMVGIAALYYVDEDTTIRASPDYWPNPEAQYPPRRRAHEQERNRTNLSVAVYRVTRGSFDISVTVANAESGEEVLAADYTFDESRNDDPERDDYQATEGPVPVDRDSSYRVTVEFDDRPTLTAEWKPPESAQEGWLVVLVTPEDVHLREVRPS